MERDLKNKTVVITGGATGIGYAIAENFIKKNSKVVIILDANEKLGEEAVMKITAEYGENKAVFHKCDVTTDLQATYEWIIDNFKTVDVLVNNAGVLEEKYIKKTIGINVIAVIEWSVKFLEHMRKDKSGKGGTIMNLASIYGFRITPFVSTYQASKFAVMGFTKSLGHEYNYSRFGVRIVAICPSFTDTVLLKDYNLMYDEVLEDFNDILKTQSLQSPAAVGAAAVDVFETADSGTAWLVEGGEPISQVL